MVSIIHCLEIRRYISFGNLERDRIVSNAQVYPKPKFENGLYGTTPADTFLKKSLKCFKSEITYMPFNVVFGNSLIALY